MMLFGVPNSAGFFKKALALFKHGGSPSEDSADHRGRLRLRRAGLTGLVTLIAKGLTVGTGIITLPFASHYLGKERFGVWLTLSAIIMWMTAADMGIANSLLNTLSAADGKDDQRKARESVTSALFLVSLISIGFLALFIAVVPLIDWSALLNLTTPLAKAEITPALIAVMIFLAIRLPSSIAGCVYLAYQEGYLYQIWNGLSGLLGAVGLIVAIKLEAGLPWLVAAFLGTMLLADLVSAIYLFGWRRSWLSPHARDFNWAQAKQLLGQGIQFWIAQMSAMVLLQTDLFIVARIFGAGEVASYGTTLRLFTLIGAVQAAFVYPLWAAYGEAAARGDSRWMAKTFKRSIKLSLIWSAVASAVMFFAMPLLFKMLVTPEVTANVRVSFALMATEIVHTASRCIAIFLNGIGAIRLQAMFGPAAGILNLVLSWALAVWIGVEGVAWATLICLLLFWIALLGNQAARKLNEFEREGVS